MTIFNCKVTNFFVKSKYLTQKMFNYANNYSSLRINLPGQSP